MTLTLIMAVSNANGSGHRASGTAAGQVRRQALMFLLTGIERGACRGGRAFGKLQRTAAARLMPLRC
jgi:hypothetical protein